MHTQYPDRVQRPRFKDSWRSARSGYRVSPLSSTLCQNGIGPCGHTIPWSSAATKCQWSIGQRSIRVSSVSTLQYLMPEWYRTLWAQDTLIECIDQVSNIAYWVQDFEWLLSRMILYFAFPQIVIITHWSAKYSDSGPHLMFANFRHKSPYMEVQMTI